MEWSANTYRALCIICYILTVYTESLTATQDVEEHSEIILPCHQTVPKFISRTWHKGFLNSTTNLSAIGIYSEIGGLDVTRIGPPAITVAKTILPLNFTLAISSVGLRDDGYFSCKVVARGGGVQYTNTRLEVYVQPVITITSTMSSIFTEGDFITVNCTVPRVYPVKLPEGLILHWKNGSMAGDWSLNADMSRIYSVSNTWKVTIEEDGTNVSCSIVPVFGERVVVSRIISVVAKEVPKTTVVPSPSKIQYEAAIGGGIIFLMLIVFGAAIFLHKVRTRNVQDDTAHIPPNEIPQDVEDPVRGDILAAPNEDEENHFPEQRRVPIPPDEPDETDEPNALDEPVYLEVRDEDIVCAPEPISTFELWLNAAELSDATRKKLIEEGITAISDLEKLTENDIICLCLNTGQRNRLKDGLKKLRKDNISCGDDLVQIKIIPNDEGIDNKGFEPDRPATTTTHEDQPSTVDGHPSLNSKGPLPNEAEEPRSEFERWLVATGLSDARKKLQDEGITEMSDLEKISESDIRKLGLSIGERNRFKAGLKKLMINDLASVFLIRMTSKDEAPDTDAEDGKHVREEAASADTLDTPTLEEWLQTHKISEATKTILHSQEIRTITDLKMLDEGDIEDLDLKMGQRNRLIFGLRLLRSPVIAESMI